jgi:hypothetical protein
MARAKHQLPTYRSHRVTVSQCQANKTKNKMTDRETHARYNMNMKIFPNQQSNIEYLPDFLGVVFFKDLDFFENF